MRFKLKFIIPITLLVITGSTLAFETFHRRTDPPGKYEVIITLVGQIIKEGHYQPKPFDDHFSKQVFDKYFGVLDKDKLFFLQSDIDQLKKYETEIDDEIQNGSVAFFRRVNDLYKQRMPEAAALYTRLLAQPFNFTKDEKILLDEEKLTYPKNSQEREEAWRKMLKYRTLEKLVDLQEERSKLKVDSLKKSDAALEAEARNKVKKLYDRYFERLKNKFSDDDRFSFYVNAITATMDPHTDFFPPVEKRYFDEQMAGKFYGIGALLREDDGKVKIASIVTGGPAWKQGELKQDDIVLKVAQGDEEPVELAGYTTEDAVKLIRGDKGTTVKLTVRKPDGTTKNIAIVRDEVILDYTYAKSLIIHNGKSKIGYISLPEFYADFNDRNGAHSAKDVAKEVQKLKAEGVQGIILDLRFNGGGSLSDAVDMAGLFIQDGPIVQVRSRDGQTMVLRDRDKSVLYDGPLAVMVNEYSASASEILAAAMQDYKRAVIIGSPSTYGKGTVQRMFNLNDFIAGDKERYGDLGSIKLTIQKFYRVNGGSTQLKGVTPDIILPDEYFQAGERKDKAALNWDEIAKASYTPWPQAPNVTYLRKSSEQRISNSPAFNMVNENIRIIKKLDQEKEYSLDLAKFKASLEQNKKELKKADSIKDMMKELNLSNLQADLGNLKGDSTKMARNNEFIKGMRKDIYLGEAVNVVNDMIALSAKEGRPNLTNKARD